MKNQLQLEYVQLRLLIASTAESIADTYPIGSAEYKKQIQVALKEHENNRDKYRRFSVSLNSILGAARCHQRLGNSEKAVAECLDLFELDNTPAALQLKKEASLICLAVWEKQNPLPHADIIERLGPMVASLDSVSKRDPDWLKLQLLLAKAHHARAAKYLAEEKKTKETRGYIETSNRLADKLIRSLARIPGPTRDQARELVKQWNLRVSTNAGDEENALKTFSQIHLQAKDLMVEVEDQRREFLPIRQRFIAAGDSASAELKEEYEQALGLLQEKVAEVQAVLDSAIRMSGEQTSREELAGVYYLKAYGHFSMDEHFRTIVVGQYLLNQFPNANATRDAISLAVKSYLQLYLKAEADKQDSTFELSNMEALAKTMIGRWPGQAATESAAIIMSRMATQKGDLDSAEEFVRAIPKNSPGRISEELRLGQIIWFDYVQKSRQAESETVKQLQELRKRAKNFLEPNVRQLAIEGLTTVDARATVSLTDLYLDEGDAKGAFAQLESTSFAVTPLDLIKRKHPAAANPKFVSDTYKTAVRVYMAMMEVEGNAEKWVAKARGVLSGLEVSLKQTDPDTADAKLRDVYVRLAKESRDQMDRISDPQKKVKFATSLLSFLDAVQKTAGDVQTLLWTGRTLNGIGESLNQTGDRVTSRRVFQAAQQSFEKARSKGLGSGNEAAKLELELNRQVAVAYRGQGEFEKAIKLLADQLTEKAYVDVQIEAALTYQMWADAEKSDQAARINNYAKAIMGGEKRPVPNRRPAKVIWGWNKLTKSIVNVPQFKQQFYESLYNRGYCMLQYGKLKKQKKLMESALNEIIRFSKRDPEMGGLRSRFDKLVRQLQAETGNQATGIGS